MDVAYYVDKSNALRASDGARINKRDEQVGPGTRRQYNLHYRKSAS